MRIWKKLLFKTSSFFFKALIFVEKITPSVISAIGLDFIHEYCSYVRLANKTKILFHRSRPVESRFIGSIHQISCKPTCITTEIWIFDQRKEPSWYQLSLEKRKEQTTNLTSLKKKSNVVKSKPVLCKGNLPFFDAQKIVNGTKEVLGSTLITLKDGTIEEQYLHTG